MEAQKDVRRDALIIQIFKWKLFESKESHFNIDFDVMRMIKNHYFHYLIMSAIAIVQHNGFELKFVFEQDLISAYMETNVQFAKQVAIAAVKQNICVLQILTPSLMNDKDVAMTAVKKHAGALQILSPSFRNDKDVAIAAMKQHSSAWHLLTPSLRNDKDVAIFAVKQKQYCVGFT